MANSNSSLTGQDGTVGQDGYASARDEVNSLSMATMGRAEKLADVHVLPAFPVRERSGPEQLNDWIRRCNSRITTLRRKAGNDALPESRASMLAAFPDNLQFPIGALFDFANRLGKYEHKGLNEKVSLETQTIISGILYLQQQLEHEFAPGSVINNQHLAYSRHESEATWSCYRDLIRCCRPDQNWNITLADDKTCYLPVPTLDIRLIIQNVLFAIMDDSNRHLPLDIHIANVAVPRIGKNCFSMAIKVPGYPIGNVISSTWFRNYKSSNFIFDGSGIGHIIAARLAGFLGGDIIISNDSVNVDTINILIPLERGEIVIPPKPVSRPVWNSRSGSKITENTDDFSVLYIEDLQSHAALVRQIFERLSDISLQVATTARAGLEIAKTEKPDLILLDMELPDMKGIELFQRLRANPETSGITVFAVSAAAMPHQIGQALELGIKHYLTKPFSYKELIHMIQEEQSNKARRVLQ